jgi:hypothetical protein
MSIVFKDTITGVEYPPVSNYWFMLWDEQLRRKCKDRSWRFCPEHRAEFLRELEEEIKTNNKENTMQVVPEECECTKRKKCQVCKEQCQCDGCLTERAFNVVNNTTMKEGK